MCTLTLQAISKKSHQYSFHLIIPTFVSDDHHTIEIPLMKDSHLIIDKRSKHIYLEIKSIKKIVACLKYTIKHDQKIINYEIMQLNIYEKRVHHTDKIKKEKCIKKYFRVQKCVPEVYMPYEAILINKATIYVSLVM